MAYSSGKYSYGICDKTGFRYATKDLVFEFRNGSKTGLRVGVDVVDPDHPQNFIGRIKFDDPQSIQDARPDRVEPATEVILDKDSGEPRLSHKIDLSTGMYKGREILKKKTKEDN